MARSKQAGLKARAITRTDGMSVAGGPLSRRAFLGVVAQAAALAAAAGSVGCTPALGDDSSADGPAPEDGAMTWGTQAYRGFTLDNVFHAPDGSDVHFSLYVPQGVTLGAPGEAGQSLGIEAPSASDASDGAVARGGHALYIALPGWEGLYFQGVGENMHEAFPYEAQHYDEGMVIVSPQLNDWGQTSAEQTVMLTRHFIQAYDIDPGRVYVSGYSGGGETLSLMFDLAPDLYAAALHCSSQWDGGFDALVDARTPVRFVIGESDEYYGTASVQDAYAQIRERYEGMGLSEQEIDDLVVLDIKDASYFGQGGAQGGGANQHGAGSILFARDEEVMGWLFSHAR